MNLDGRLADVGRTINTWMAKASWATADDTESVTCDPGFTPDEWFITVNNKTGGASNTITATYTLIYEDGTEIAHGTSTAVDGSVVAFVTITTRVPQLKITVTEAGGESIDSTVEIHVKARRFAPDAAEESSLPDHLTLTTA
jgi:hypothetical protein